MHARYKRGEHASLQRSSTVPWLIALDPIQLYSTDPTVLRYCTSCTDPTVLAVQYSTRA